MVQRPEKLSSRFVRSVTELGRYTDGRGGFGLSILVCVFQAKVATRSN